MRTCFPHLFPTSSWVPLGSASQGVQIERAHPTPSHPELLWASIATEATPIQPEWIKWKFYPFSCISLQLTHHPPAQATFLPDPGLVSSLASPPSLGLSSPNPSCIQRALSELHVQPSASQLPKPSLAPRSDPSFCPFVRPAPAHLLSSSSPGIFFFLCPFCTSLSLPASLALSLNPWAGSLAGAGSQVASGLFNQGLSRPTHPKRSEGGPG